MACQDLEDSRYKALYCPFYHIYLQGIIIISDLVSEQGFQLACCFCTSSDRCCTAWCSASSDWKARHAANGDEMQFPELGIH